MAEKANLSFPVEGGVSTVAFSPHEESSNLLAVGGPSKITIKSCALKENVSEFEGLLDLLSMKSLFSVLHDNAGTITWLPSSSHLDGQFRFCASEGNNGSIIIFSSSIESSTSESLPGHRNFLNDLCAHPTDHTLLASVGDDCVCRVWDLQQGQLRSEYRLGSPGMSVRWHKLDPVKLMVTEKKGRVRFYDIFSDSPILSLDSPAPPLTDADWAPSNSLLVGGVAGGSWCLWDLSKSSQPLESKVVHKAPLVKFRWCYGSADIFTTLSASSQLKIHHVSHQRVLVSCDLQAATDLSWSAQIPLLGVACDRVLNCWSVET